MVKKLDKLLDIVETLDFRYFPDTSTGEEYPNDHYEASRGNLTFKMSGVDYLYVYKGYGNDKEQILCINAPKARLEKIYSKANKIHLEQERIAREAQEKKKKQEKEKIARQGFEGNIEEVLKNL